MDGSKLITSKRICGRLARILLKKSFEDRRNKISFQNLHKNLLIKHLTDYGQQKINKHLKVQFPWEKDEVITQHKSILNRISAEWITTRVEEETRLSRAFGIKNFYPFLDESLIAILLKTNVTYFSKCGNERFLIRELFKNYLPNYLYENPKKFRFVSESTKENRKKIYLDKINYFITIMKEKNLLAKKIWKIENIIKDINSIIDSHNSTNQQVIDCCVALSKINTINIWLEKLSE